MDFQPSTRRRRIGMTDAWNGIFGSSCYPFHLEWLRYGVSSEVVQTDAYYRDPPLCRMERDG